MRVALVLGLVLATAPAHAGAADSAPPVRLNDRETIVFYGDSITEQNLYTAYLETFLLSRFPSKELAVFNMGWSGDTASGGDKRYARDVGSVRPTLVFVNFGMNDGGYKAYDETTYRTYIDAQRALADTIRAAGSRQVLFTTSPVDDVVRKDGGVYNETLARMARGLGALADERGLPLIDLFQPMLDVQHRAKEKDARFTMIPDAIHPDAVGHLVMAYFAMRRIDAPREVGSIVVEGNSVRAQGVTTGNVVAADGEVRFDLTLPFLPFYVPKEARAALDLVPLQDELNRFRLQVAPGTGSEPLVLSVDGKTAGTFTREELARGIDLAQLDGAGWSVAGRTLWEAAQFRWKQHFDAWRVMGLQKPAFMMPSLPTFEAHARAQRAYADELGRSLRTLAKPGTYHVALRPQGGPVAIGSVELSPTYPFASFDAPQPPETDPASVKWTSVPLVDGTLDIGARLTGSYVVAYARVVLQADRATTLHLSMGSDDGLAVFLGGQRVFARDVMRSLRKGEDELELPLAAGRNQVLFKVTQGGGDFALAFEARVLGRAKVEPVAP
ncbi:MAG TPA: SGNH/GDSL hydrolase family protein [Vicinamibacteria bacterium]|nr:SGNH/GDSL hydrolase family protein [Vicinamibacteria bacterium]